MVWNNLALLQRIASKRQLFEVSFLQHVKDIGFITSHAHLSRLRLKCVRLIARARGLPFRSYCPLGCETGTSRCSGGHGFDSRRGIRTFLCPTLVSCWLIHLHISLPSLKRTIFIDLSGLFLLSVMSFSITSTQCIMVAWPHLVSYSFNFYCWQLQRTSINMRHKLNMPSLELCGWLPGLWMRARLEVALNAN